jgi:hypothetical protein
VDEDTAAQYVATAAAAVSNAVKMRERTEEARAGAQRVADAAKVARQCELAARRVAARTTVIHRPQSSSR